MVVLALAAAVVVVVAAVSAYLTLTRAPIPLSISDGSVFGLIRGNLTSVSSGSPLALYLNATTRATQGAGPSSTLIMQVVTWTYFVAGPQGHYYDGGYIDTNFNVTIRGHFASNLHPVVLQFTVGEIAAIQAGGGLDIVWTEPGYQTGTNVTFDHNQELAFFGTGSAAGTETLTSSASSGPYYDFAYGDWVDAWGYVGHNRLVSIRASIEGPFAPAVSLEMGFAIVDAPA